MDNRKNMEEELVRACEDLCKLLEKETESAARTQRHIFRRLRRYSDLEIRAFEERFVFKLPEAYRYFLKVVGASRVFVNEFGLGVTFHPLEDLGKFHQEVFAGMGCPFPDLLLIASDLGTGCVFGFDLSHGNGHPNFASFSPEEDPEKWVAQTTDWFVFERWLSALVSLGEAP